MITGGLAPNAGPIIRGLDEAGEAYDALRGVSRSEVPRTLFYYTDDYTAGLIETSQLGVPGRTLYLTNRGDLSPLQAQIELALPRANTATAVFEVYTGGLDRSRLLLDRRVTGNVFGRGGGGYEFLFEGTIPLQAVRRIR